MSMRTSFPIQSRLLTQDEKDRVSGLAARNGVSVSALIRLLALQADREGWSLEVQRKKKAGADG
jgi:hypothetical protein